VGYNSISNGDITLNAWYPAAQPGAALSLGFIAGTAREETEAFLERTGVSRRTVDSLFASPLYSTLATLRAQGRFPLVLIAHGNGQDAMDQAILSEYVASHGFVVASIQSPMRKAPMQREDQVGEFAERQASALAEVLRFAAANLPADTTRIGIIGHSFGARAALLLAMRDHRVSAIVSLDGGIGTATATESFRQAPSFRPEATIPPLLHFHEELDAFMAPDFTLLRSLEQSALALEPTRGMRHVHFTIYGFASALFADVARVTRATPETRAGVVAVAERTAAFLRQHLVTGSER
jgi:dienelactone hydrolase